MCGLVAWYSTEAIDRAKFENALHTLSHRGPDGWGVWYHPNGKVAIGHRRLAIMDVDHGAQPLFSEDKHIVCVVNGELYDHERIRKELEQKGHTFKTRSDSEILVHLYQEHGYKALEHLRGEFSFILWDERTQSLFVARDRFGVKPICFSHMKNTIMFASEAKSLFAMGHQPRWCLNSLGHVFSAQYCPSGQTIFGGIEIVKPGHYLVIKHGTIHDHTYWDMHDTSPSASVDESQQRSELQLAEQIRNKFEEAVRLRLISDVPVVFQLSGGLDSTAVLGVAKPYLPNKPVCYSVSFQVTHPSLLAYDEGSLVEKTADWAGAELRKLSVSAKDLCDCLIPAISQAEGFAINAHIAAKYLLAKTIRQDGYKVVLTGEGSDEIFGGYPHFREDMIHQEGSDQNQIERLRHENLASRGIMVASGLGLSLSHLEAELGFTPAYLSAKASLGHRVYELLNPQYRKHLTTIDWYKQIIVNEMPNSVKEQTSRLRKSMYLWSKQALAGYILKTLGDAVEMSHSIEARLPFLDHHLYESTKSLGDHCLIDQGVEKKILREAVRNFVPEHVAERKKHPFMSPPLLVGNYQTYRNLLLDTLSSCESHCIFKRDAVEKTLEQVPDMPIEWVAALEPALMTVLSYCVLSQRYQLGSPL